ncbi:hypothetical protein ACF3VQ_03395 [Yersinia sp. HM-2024]
MMELQDCELNYIEKWLPEMTVKYKDGHTPEIRSKMVECVFSHI